MSDRKDMELIAELVPTGSRVLDLGCGNGELLAHLRDRRRCDGYGIEIDAPHGHDAFLLDDPRYHGVMRACFERLALGTSPSGRHRIHPHPARSFEGAGSTQ